MSQDLGLRVDVQLTNGDALPLLPPDNNEQLRAIRLCYDELYTELYEEAEALVKDKSRAKEIVFNTYIAYYILNTKKPASPKQIADCLFLTLKEYCILPHEIKKTEIQKSTFQAIKQACNNSRTVPVLRDSEDCEEAKQVFELVYFQNLEIEEAAKKERITPLVANGYFNKALAVLCFLLHGITNFKH